MNNKKNIIIIFICFFSFFSYAQNSYKLAVLKYNGGGDWYANPTSLKNLVKFCNKNIYTNIKENVATVEVSSKDIFNYPFIHMTGHGNVVFNEEEINNLQTYLLAGGFLHIDDNYGMDKFIRREIEKLFPNNKLEILSDNHPIFNIKYKFEKLPKIHEHNQNPAQALGIVKDGRLLLLYTYESDLGDGWEDKEIHNDSDEVRTKSLKMGANIIKYVFTH